MQILKAVFVGGWLVGWLGLDGGWITGNIFFVIFWFTFLRKIASPTDHTVTNLYALHQLPSRYGWNQKCFFLLRKGQIRWTKVGHSTSLGFQCSKILPYLSGKCFGQLYWSYGQKKAFVGTSQTNFDLLDEWLFHPICGKCDPFYGGKVGENTSPTTSSIICNKSGQWKLGEHFFQSQESLLTAWDAASVTNAPIMMSCVRMLPSKVPLRSSLLRRSQTTRQA